MNTFRVTPARQSLGRDITPLESALAEALEAIFATGQHDSVQVAAELQRRGVVRPSGSQGEWTVPILEHELQQINQSLDAAYVGRQHGAPADAS